MRFASCWLVVAGCGRIGFDGTPDANAIDATDAPDPTTMVGTMLPPGLTTGDHELLGPFGAPQVVTELSEPNIEDDDPCLTRDQLEIFFDRDDANTTGHDIWTSRRVSITDAWPRPVRIDSINSDAHDEHPAITSDGLRLYFSSERGGGRNELYVASRSDRDSQWGNVELVSALNSDKDEDMGSVSADELVLVFSSKRPDMGTDDLYESRRAGPSEPWGPPLLLAEVSSASYDRSAHVDDRGLVMFFETAAQTQLKWTKRETLGAAWAPARDLDDFDLTGFNVSDPWLSPDLRTIYFVRYETNLGKDIYFATR